MAEMSERAERLRKALSGAINAGLSDAEEPGGIARAIVTELGITSETVEDFHHADCGFQHEGEYYCVVCDVADALAALLEVASNG